MSAILLQNATATPTLQRLNSREMMRSLPRSEEAQAAADKAKKNAQWLAPPLAPKVMEPERRSKAADVSERLQRIEYIEVADVVKHDDDSKNYYVINIFLKKEHSRIPTNFVHRQRVLHQHHGHHHHNEVAAPTGKPDFTIHHRFSEFDQLKKDIWSSVQQPHRHYCSFCDSFMFMLLFSSSQPGVVSKTLIPSTHFRAKMLDKFLHKIISEFQLNRPRCRFACYSQDHLPVILDKFLFGEQRHEEEEELEEDPAASPTGRVSL